MVKNKPNPESYNRACGIYQPNECVMIGDDMKKDINGALNIGMKAILFDPNNKCKTYEKKINKIIELKEML